MKDEHFFVVQGWMVNRLHLSGTELMVYAIINGFCQHGDGDGFVGGNATLMSWTGASARTIGMTLQSLEKKGLIEREYIKTAKGRLGKIRTHGAESAPPIAQNLPDGCGKNCATHEAKIAPITYNLNTKNISPDGEIEKRAQAPSGDPAEDLAPQVQEAFRDYVQMRTKIKATMTDKAKAMAIAKLKKLASDPETQVEILNQSTMNSWKGLYELKEEREDRKQRQQPKGTFFAFPQREIDEEDEEALELRLRRKALGKD